jgi:ABC-type Fe3+/spermidine/putrescine transport system ATPase subunit
MIDLKAATKVFDQRGIAGIHKLDLSIKKGSIFALMGPNGSGKTTLLNLISGKLPLDSGMLKVKGSIHFFERRDFEKDLNVQRFLIEAVTLDIDTDKKIQLSRDMADIFEFTSQLRQNMGQLSQGQLQKVLMASELINQPDILFLDEPFIHLDPMSRKDILEMLFHYLRQKEVTVVWITHEKDEALRFSDTVALIQHGKLEQVSTPVKILREPRNLFVAQFFGHQNFIKINSENGVWKTAWGDVASELKATEGYLIVPPSAWKIDSASTLQGVILGLYPQYFVCEIELDVNEKRFKVALPLEAFDKWKKGQKMNLSPDLSQCFVIGL